MQLHEKKLQINNIKLFGKRCEFFNMFNELFYHFYKLSQ